MPSDLTDVLRRAPLLAGLSDAQLAAAAEAAAVRTYGPGQVVFEQGDLGREVFVVLDGEVEIRYLPASLGDAGPAVSGPRVLARLGSGEQFGDLALLDDSPRSATVVTTADLTRVLALDAAIVEALTERDAGIGLAVYRNAGVGVAAIARRQTQQAVDAVLRDHVVVVLAEELADETSYCDPSTPVEKTLATTDTQSFVLRVPGRLGPAAVDKEVYRLAVFAHLSELRHAFDGSEPTGVQVLGQLFALLRDGALDPAFEPDAFEHRIDDPDRRRGLVAFSKTTAGRQDGDWYLSWQVKHVEVADGVATATIVLELAAGDPGAAARHLDGVVAAMDMPVQRLASAAIESDPPLGAGFRVFTVHHRTGEVAATLASLRRHGFAIDTFIGIPYGRASWLSARMLDRASDHHYFCLSSTEHPVRPTEWGFDFAQSSFVPGAELDALDAMFPPGARPTEYLHSMNQLVGHRLAVALETCFATGERLVVFEDGGYVVPLLHAAVADPDHPLHGLVRRALDGGVVVGAVEVTTAGERRDREVVTRDGGLVPVLSCAAEEIKQVFEGLGVSVAVVDAASTALGNLGQPTFAVRRVAVLGGNGAIGVRMIEELALRHNGTANLFSVDVADEWFRRDLDAQRFPHAAIRVAYHPFARFTPAPDARVEIVDRPLGDAGPPDVAALERALVRALGDGGPPEYVRTSSFPSAGAESIEGTVCSAADATGWKADGPGMDLPRGGGRAWSLVRGDERRRVVLLAPGTVLNYRDLARPISAGVDTVIGVTGFEAFREADLDAFLERERGADPDGLDSLVLISGSSKDYEYKLALTVLSRLVRLQERAAPAEERLAWLRSFHADGRVFARDLDKSLLSGEGGDLEARVEALTEQLGSVIRLHKEVWPDVGLRYPITYRGRAKELVLLANGFVINFFAHYEKGVKTEYIDPIVTMQLLAVARMTRADIPAGLHAASAYLDEDDVARLWEGLERRCSPLDLTP